MFTALLAWFAFRENFDRRIAIGMLAIVAGAAVLSWPGEAHFGAAWPALAVLGACGAWAVDNNLTRKVALNDATWIASVKGLAAGSVNLLLALWAGSTLPPATLLASGMALGLAAYGISLVLFVIGLRDLGTARTGAYFSVAPFFGAVHRWPTRRRTFRRTQRCGPREPPARAAKRRCCDRPSALRPEPRAQQHWTWTCLQEPWRRQPHRLYRPVLLWPNP